MCMYIYTYIPIYICIYFNKKKDALHRSFYGSLPPYTPPQTLLLAVTSPFCPKICLW